MYTSCVKFIMFVLIHSWTLRLHIPTLICASLQMSHTHGDPGK